MSDRIGLEEAKSLAVLFRQSEELGTSLTEPELLGWARELGRRPLVPRRT